MNLAHFNDGWTIKFNTTWRRQLMQLFNEEHVLSLFIIQQENIMDTKDK